MKNKELISEVWAMAEKACRNAGVSLWDVTFEKEGGDFVLTVYIDREDGVFIEDCEKVSREIDPQLDEPRFDSLPPYTLTVSSAGLERRLTRPEHFEWAKGKKVEIGNYKGEHTVGELVSCENGDVTVKVGEETVTVEKTKHGGVKLYFEK